MALHKIKDFDPDYMERFDEDIIGLDLYSGNDKVGTVDDILVDDNGSFRYFVIHTGAWILGKKTLLPIGRARVATNERRVYADGLSKSQIENLPEYDENSTIDFDREERTRDVYRSPMTAGTGVAAGAGMGANTSPMAMDDTTMTGSDLPAPPPGMTAVDTFTTTRAMQSTDPMPMVSPAMTQRDDYSYDRDADLYDINHPDRQTLKLYEERLIANKTRQKTGEVSIGKHVETENATVSVPVEKERVVIERTPGDGRVVTPGEATFQSGEVARMEVYEETPDIHKEAYVREEVSIRKEVNVETVEAHEQLRREELDIDKEGRTIDERNIA
jgi:uncharacterized protein (TIGR02271 family)